MKQFTIANQYGDTKRYTGLVHTDEYVYLVTTSKYHHETLSVDGLAWQEHGKKLQAGRFDQPGPRMSTDSYAGALQIGCRNYAFHNDDVDVVLDRRINGYDVPEQDDGVPMAKREVCVPNEHRVLYRDAVGYGYINGKACWVGLCEVNAGWPGWHQERLAIDVIRGTHGGLRYARSQICNDLVQVVRHSTIMQYRGSGVVTQVKPHIVEHMLLRGFPDGTLGSVSLKGPGDDVTPVFRLYKPELQPWEIAKSVEEYVLDVDIEVNEQWSATDFVLSPDGRYLVLSATIAKQKDAEIGPFDVTGLQVFELDRDAKTTRKRCEFNFSSLHLAFSPDGQTLATFGYDLRPARRDDGSNYVKPSGTLTVMDVDF